jgi:hypothetical protein
VDHLYKELAVVVAVVQVRVVLVDLVVVMMEVVDLLV